MRLWPFVHWRQLEAMRLENGLLREALKQANEEIRKHRLLIGGLQEIEGITKKLESVLRKK